MWADCFAVLLILNNIWDDIIWINHNEIADCPSIWNVFFLKNNELEIITPMIRDKIIIYLFIDGIINIWLGIWIHKYIKPKNTENKDIFIIEFSIIWSVMINISGFDFNVNLDVDSISRNEYMVVIAIDIIIRREIYMVRFEYIIFSIIESFEKNPDINGIPIKDRFDILKMHKVMGQLYNIDPIWRISW